MLKNPGLMLTHNEIAVRLTAVRERIARAAARAKHDPATVRLVLASKTQPPEAVRAAYAAGANGAVAAVPPDVIEGGFVPTSVGWARSFHALHEWIGLAVYSVRAWRSAPSNKAA